MDNYRADESRRRCCYFHPEELVVGICAVCLNERLLVLASNQAPKLHRNSNLAPKKSSIALVKILALIHRLQIKHHKSHHFHRSSSSSAQDSFISINFEDNRTASWDKEKKISKISDDLKSWNDHSNWDKAKKIKSVVEHSKPRAALRWRRRIGRLFHVVSWKRSNKGNRCHVINTKARSKVFTKEDKM